jgi:ATP sulfurylase
VNDYADTRHAEARLAARGRVPTQPDHRAHEYLTKVAGAVDGPLIHPLVGG